MDLTKAKNIAWKVLKYFFYTLFWFLLFIIIFFWVIFFKYFYNSSYLIVLQNAGEARPWWGFFGSVAILKFDWFKPSLKLEDAYKYQILAKEKKIYMPTPKYLVEPLMTDKLYFLNTNIYGISKIDAKNIKLLYEKITNKKLDGVVLLNSLWFEKIDKNLEHKIWEWQFLNALNYNTPLKSKFDTRKKEYIKSFKKYVKENYFYILKTIFKNYKFFTENAYLQVYRQDSIKLLENLWLLKNYDSNTFYSFDFYLSFSKFSRFIRKEIRVNWKKYIDKNYIKLWKNFKWKIEIKYYWDKNLFKEYKKYIKYLEKKYNKKLDNEQSSILALDLLNNYNLSIFYLPSYDFIYPAFCKKTAKILTCLHNLKENRCEHIEIIFK